MYCQTIPSVRDIYRDDRARIATCTLRTPTDRNKENYSIDGRANVSAAVCISILLNVVIQSGGVLSTCVMSIVLFARVFNFVLLQ